MVQTKEADTMNDSKTWQMRYNYLLMKMRNLERELKENAINSGPRTEKYYSMFYKMIEKELDSVERNLPAIKFEEPLI